MKLTYYYLMIIYQFLLSIFVGKFKNVPIFKFYAGLENTIYPTMKKQAGRFLSGQSEVNFLISSTLNTAKTTIN